MIGWVGDRTGCSFSLCSRSPTSSIAGCWSVALLWVASGSAGVGAGGIPVSHCSGAGRCSAGPWGQGCAGWPSSPSLQQLVPAGQSGVTRSLDPSHDSASLFLLIQNCPWPPHHGLVSPGDSWQLVFCQPVRAAPCGEKRCGLCAVQFVCLMQSQGLIPGLEGTFPGWGL